MKQHYLGIDGGGTHTRALLADHIGKILGTGCAGSSNRNHYSRDQVRENLRTAMMQAHGDQAIAAGTTIFLGMCGVSNDADRADIVSIVREISEAKAVEKIIVDNDAIIGLAGGLSGRPGIVLIAGTGSACFGINANGQSYWCGGWGALADDAGSAAWIGTKAIQTAVRAEDGRAAATTLRQIVFDFLELKHPRELIDRVHNQGLSREEIGQLAPRAIEAMKQGDAAATAIMREAAEELSLLVSVTASDLFGSNPCEMILVGGLALSGPPFQELLIETIQRRSPHVKVRAPEMSPVCGAVLKALNADGITGTPEIFSQLRKGTSCDSDVG
ncbi:MAG TPA: BadF/BadG/BcrA/BcrD ATPase family protein [Tepidisphaeraceae bacterium]